MIIRIMRHGDAPLIDGVRQLSTRGIEEAGKMGQWLSEQSQPDMVLVSPLLRAQQTSEQVEPFLAQDYKRADEDLLKPETDATIARHYFESLDSTNLLLVSHMPFVVNLLEAWLPQQARFFSTASIAELELIDGGVRLNRFVSPSDLS